MSDVLEDRLAEIRVRFVSLLCTRGETIQNAIGLIETERCARSALKDVQNELHKITGTAATLGFRDLGERARHFEERIENCPDHAGAELDELLAGLKELQQMIMKICKDAG